MEDNRKLMMEKTAEVYDFQAKAMRDVIPVVEKFDGKVFNKRIETAMMNVLGQGYYVKWKREYSWLEIEFDYFNNWSDSGRFYTRNREAYVRFMKRAEVLESDGYHERIKAAPIIEGLKKEADRLQKKAAMIREAIENGDEIVAGMVKIAEELRTYRSQYDIEVLELLGAYCVLNNQSPDTNRAIKCW